MDIHPNNCQPNFTVIMQETETVAHVIRTNTGHSPSITQLSLALGRTEELILEAMEYGPAINAETAPPVSPSSL
ncbi:hypothetical protein B0H94_10128 [Salsuginibacillus halophilus]|uniref:Uncharacterized protein n=1 Tax=Salsuginibacillus halophilus TaxID=517424 RepID=A0A2P8HY10_9BACI|nr:hypothetical protein [Salsuginibacillus halophilus]PSL51118.1 hypothetical protein B0H94_10128 [Salsuginibacillus halophilus]